jgi:hypothetical protein
MQNLNRLFRSFFLAHNINCTRTTPPELIKSFLQLVAPKTTNFKLVRVGGEKDGGYLIPDDLAEIGACFSPGVSNVADFEKELAENGIRCFLADYSVDGPPIRSELFDFEKKFLGQVEDERFMTLETWVNRKAPIGLYLILQMDIEGGEYDVIFDTSSETLKRFRIIVAEFHGLDGLLNPEAYKLITCVFRKLLRDFEVVHIHPNNCSAPVKYKSFVIPPVMEFTFHRKERIAGTMPTHSFPHWLDRRNVARKADLPLPPCWYR